MKKSTKGAVAAAAAGVLLLGGAGSLAFWSDSLTVGGGTISSGHLALDDTTGATGTCSDADWLLDGGTVFDTTDGRLVPGDTLTKNCTFDVNATGEHLTADLAATGGTATGLAQVSTDVDFTVAGSPASSIDVTNDGDEVSATITLTFTGSTATNVSQDDSVVLTDYTVTATQVHS